jgi:hypothetical protein
LFSDERTYKSAEKSSESNVFKPLFDRVIEILNRITKERINVTVIMGSYPYSSIDSKINSKLADKQQLDLFCGYRIFASLAARNTIDPLDDLPQ